MSAEPSIECGACRRAYSFIAWSSLAVVRTLTSHELRAYVSTWEDARVIEVRACATCGRSMARTTTRAA
jgi:hypothetical protein